MPGKFWKESPSDGWNILDKSSLRWWEYTVIAVLMITLTFLLLPEKLKGWRGK